MTKFFIPHLREDPAAAAAEWQRYLDESGAPQVSGIIDAGDRVYVWSYGPPFGGWANPSFVGRREVTHAEYFDDATAETDATTTER